MCINSIVIFSDIFKEELEFKVFSSLSNLIQSSSNMLLMTSIVKGVPIIGASNLFAI